MNENQNEAKQIETNEIQQKTETGEAKPSGRPFKSGLLIGAGLLLTAFIPVGDVDGDQNTDIAGKWLMYQAMRANEISKSSQQPKFQKLQVIDKEEGMKAIAGAYAANPPRPEINRYERQLEDDIAEKIAEEKAKVEQEGGTWTPDMSARIEKDLSDQFQEKMNKMFADLESSRKNKNSKKKPESESDAETEDESRNTDSE